MEDEIDGKERVKHLQTIYAALASKGVPNVDRLKRSEIWHNTRGSYADLEPIGKNRSPQSPKDIRIAVMCILETLKVVLTSLSNAVDRHAMLTPKYFFAIFVGRMSYETKKTLPTGF